MMGFVYNLFNDFGRFPTTSIMWSSASWHDQKGSNIRTGCSFLTNNTSNWFKFSILVFVVLLLLNPSRSRIWFCQSCIISIRSFCCPSMWRTQRCSCCIFSTICFRPTFHPNRLKRFYLIEHSMFRLSSCNNLRNVKMFSSALPLVRDLRESWWLLRFELELDFSFGICFGHRFIAMV